MIEIVKEHTTNVQRWRDGTMALRLVAGGMGAASDRSGWVNGYRQILQLVVAFENATADEPGTFDLAITSRWSDRHLEAPLPKLHGTRDIL